MRAVSLSAEWMFCVGKWSRGAAGKSPVALAATAQRILLILAAIWRMPETRSTMRSIGLALIPIQGADAERMRKFITDIDPARLGTIEVKSISPPSVPAASETRYLENSGRIARIYGADEYSERVVVFAFEGSDYAMGFQLLRYGDKWKVMDQSSPLAGINVMGIPEKQ